MKRLNWKRVGAGIPAPSIVFKNIGAVESVEALLGSGA